MELASERVYYVHCNFCNTILAVSVPCSNMLNIVTVRCGHCGNLLSVTMGVSASLQPFPPPNPTTTTTTTAQKQFTCGFGDYNNNNNCKEAMCGSSSAPKCNFRSINDLQQEVPKIPTPRPPEKRQRVPSAYNRFIKEEIQRIKASNPDISHREAFSAAAKNWAHFPHIHFGLKLDGSNQTKLDQATVVGTEGSQESNGFY